MIKKKTRYIHIHIVFFREYIFISCLLHFWIFKFSFIYLLHVLFVLKIERFLKREKVQKILN